MTATYRSRLLSLARRKGVFAANEATSVGIHSQQLTRLVAEGVLERVASGRYGLTDRPLTEHHAIVLASRSAPHGVISLLSALAYHRIGTQLPSEVWITLPRGVRAPRLAHFHLRVIRATGACLTEEVAIHRLEGHAVRITSVARTIADLFKHRNRVGLDVALEALKDAWRKRRFRMEDLNRAARICRVERVMRPYVEAVVA
jgi:predicted transcriptional regulator of viral defense system